MCKLLMVVNKVGSTLTQIQSKLSKTLMFQVLSNKKNLGIYIHLLNISVTFSPVGKPCSNISDLQAEEGEFHTSYC